MLGGFFGWNVWIGCMTSSGQADRPTTTLDTLDFRQLGFNPATLHRCISASHRITSHCPPSARGPPLRPRSNTLWTGSSTNVNVSVRALRKTDGADGASRGPSSTASRSASLRPPVCLSVRVFVRLGLPKTPARSTTPMTLLGQGNFVRGDVPHNKHVLDPQATNKQTPPVACSGWRKSTRVRRLGKNGAIHLTCANGSGRDTVSVVECFGGLEESDS